MHGIQVASQKQQTGKRGLSLRSASEAHMQSGILIGFLITLVVNATFRAMILSKYRNDLSEIASESAIGKLLQFKKTKPIPGNLLILSSALHVLCLAALAVALLIRLLS
jgi:hypothetical protein